jgi:hypothetical protein
MLNYQIKTYNPEIEVTEFHFYILNKGLNSGKPLLEPCPNCFVCTFKTEVEKEQLYWLVFGLWQGKVFRQSLLGSVIPYIRLKCLKEVIQLGITKYLSNPEKAKKNISTINQIEKQRINILKQLDLMKQIKLALMFEILK